MTSFLPDPFCHHCTTYLAGQPKTGFCPEHLARLPQTIQDIWILATEARLHCSPYDGLPYWNIQLHIIRHYRPKVAPIPPRKISLEELGLS